MYLRKERRVAPAPGRLKFNLHLQVVRQLDDEEELLEVLDYVDSLRLRLTESNQILYGVVRGAISNEPTNATDG